MFLPLGDEPNPRGTPVVTYSLIGVNVAVYCFLTLPLSAVRPDFDDPRVAEYVQLFARYLSRMSLDDFLRQISAYDLVVFSYGYRPAAPEVTALFTSMFLHGGLMHLAGNMLFLWIYGDNVEHRLGPARFLLAYLATGLAATLMHSVLDARSVIPVVGASGAISGVLGFYFIWFPRNRVRLLVMFPLMHIFYAPARLVLGIYLIVQNLFPFLASRGIEDGGGVAYGAHIGGFLAGLGTAWWAERRGVQAGPREYRRAPAETPAAPIAAAQEEVARLIGGGRFHDAADAYFQVPSERSRRVLEPHDSISLSNWLANHGHPAAALVVYQRHLRDYPLGPYAAEAHLGAGLVQLHAQHQPTAAYQHLVAVFDLDPHPETAQHARDALADIADRQKFRVGRVH